MARKTAGPKYGSVSHQVPGGVLSIRSLSPELLRDVVEGVVCQGDCIMFSRTRDGGAIHIRILADGLVEKWYAGNELELVDLFKGLQMALEAVEG